MEEIERQYVLGQIGAVEYLKARTGRKASTKSVRHQTGKPSLPKSDIVAIASFREFLKHAGPPPKVSPAPSPKGTEA